MKIPTPADGIAWGPPDHGLRMGLAFGPASPDQQLRIVFQNVDRPECLIPLGSISARGSVYDAEFEWLGARDARPGEWLIRHPENRLAVVPDALFRELYEPAPGEPGWPN